MHLGVRSIAFLTVFHMEYVSLKISGLHRNRMLYNQNKLMQLSPNIFIVLNNVRLLNIIYTWTLKT